MAGQVIFSGHPSWRSEIMLSYLFRTVLVVLLGNGVLFGVRHFEYLSGGLSLLAMFVWTVGCIGVLVLLRRQCIYRVTSTNVYKKTGIINIDKDEYHLRNVVTVGVNQGRFERWITRTGDVEFTTAAEQKNIVFEGVPNPDKLADRVRAAQNALYSGGGQWGGPQPGGFGQAPVPQDPGFTGGRPTPPGFGPGPQQPGAGSGGGFSLPPR